MFWFINPFWFAAPPGYAYLLLPGAGIVEAPTSTAMLIPGVGMVYGA